MHATYLPLYGVALWHVTTASAQEEFPDDQDIIGCKELDCPSQDGQSTSSNCTIAGASYNGIGLAQFDVADMADATSNMTMFSWVQASNATKNPDKTGEDDSRILSSAFYLSTPDGLSTDGIRGCAAFFHGAKSKLKFSDENMETSQGTCSDAMEESCIDALLKRVQSLDLQEGSCDAVKRELEENFDSECSEASDGSEWERLSVQPIFGDTAADPISDGENSTTNCWPTVPKANDLTLIDVDSKTGDFSLDPVAEFFGGITPVLTVFFGRRFNNNSVHMTCLKTVGPSAEAAENESDGSEEDEGAAAGFGAGSASWTAMVAGIGLVGWLI